MRTPINISLIILAGLINLTGGCTYDKESIAPSCPSLPDSISFQADIIPIFNTNCNLSGCHSGSLPQGNLNLTPSAAYKELIKSGSGYIDVSNPQSSILYVQITSASQIMPPTGKLDDCTTSIILEWIQQGAKNN